MLETLRNAFKIKDIRNRILFTFFMLVVIRVSTETFSNSGLRVSPLTDLDFLMQLPVVHS